MDNSMKRQEVKELHTKTTDELKKLLKDTQDALFTLQMDHEQHKVSNTSQLRNMRKDIARILSIIRGKELANA
jgi:large subunit ribosomal protein L29